MTTLISVDQFRKDAKAKRDPKGPVFRVSLEPAADVEGATRTKRFCFSDGSVDLMGDTIDPAGWDIIDFTKNPVALWAHASSEPPIGRASNVIVEGQRLMGDIEFAPVETYAFADTIFRLVDGKFVNAVSVGFLPLEYSFVENDPDRGFGIDFKRQRLLEISLCPIPANPHALLEARRKGISTQPLVEWAERVLDSGDKIIIPRSELESLRKAAKEKPMARRPGTRRRAEDEPDDKPDDTEDKAPGGATCGRKAGDECGLKDSTECAIHGKGTKAEDDDPDDKPDDAEKRLRRLERNVDRLLSLSLVSGVSLRAEGDEPDGDELPLEHHDAVRMAHKHMKTARAYSKEESECIRRAVSLMDDVVESLNGSSEDPDGDGDDDKPDPEEKARQIRRAAEIRARLRVA